MKKGSKHTKKTLRKISESKKLFLLNGGKHSGGFMKGHIPWNKEKPWDFKTKKKMSKARLGSKMPEETKRKISKTMRGRKLSEEHIKNVSIALTGKKISKEAIAKRVAKVFGVNHPKWKGGISVGKNRKEYFRIKCLERVARKHNAKGFFTLEEWRILKNKYKNTCLSCGKKEPKIRLTIDHMKPLIILEIYNHYALVVIAKRILKLLIIENFMKSPRISVLLPTWNRSERIQNAIQSMIDQTFKNWELIIIDDGSTDGTKRVVNSFENPRIKYFEIEHQGNLPRVRNIAIQKAKGELCVVQDSDDQSFPDRLEEIWDHYIKNNKPDVIYHDFYIRFFDDTRNSFSRRIRRVGEYHQDLAIQTQYIPGQVAYKRKIALKYPYNEEIKVMDDFIFLIELALNDCIFGYIPKPLYDYVISGDSINIEADNDGRRLDDAKSIVKIMRNKYKLKASGEIKKWDRDTGAIERYEKI